MSSQLTYAVWKADNKPFLSNLSNKRVILTYSGGKDSSVVLHFMIQAAHEYGFVLEARAGVFPLHVLTKDEIKRLDAYWSGRGMCITWHEVDRSDDLLNQAIRDGVSPCFVCNRTKKGGLIDHFKQGGYDWNETVFVINYSLWDLVSATIEHILGGSLRSTRCP